MNGPNGIFVLAYIESIISIIFLLKIIFSSVIFRLKFKLKPNSGFYLYLSFAICLVIYSIIFNLELLSMMKDPPKFLLLFNPITINYAKNLFFTGSFIFLQCYLYRLVTSLDKEHVYKGSMRETKRKMRIATNLIYIFTTFGVFTQTVMIGILPQFISSIIVRPELISCFIILFGLVPVMYFHIGIESYKNITFTWVWYYIVCLLILPISFFLNFFNTYADFIELQSNIENLALIIQTCLRAPFIVLRVLEFLILLSNIFRLADVRSCHD